MEQTRKLDPVENPTLTVPATAEYLGISRISAYRAIKANEIPAIKIGTKILVPTAALLKMVGQ